MDTTLFAAAQAVKINQGMMPLDWGIIITMIVALIAILIYCNRFMRNAADFLAASRCAGRYVLSIAEGVAGFAVVSSVATFEMFYEAGFTSTWWSMLTSPITLILSLTGYVTYRFRETRCFTLSQFFEVRYSRKFRVVTGIITWLSGIVNYGIFPAVSVRFFMYFCRFPKSFCFLGVNWDTYAVLLTFAIGIAVYFTICGGQIAIMVTDFIQGVFCNAAFLVFILFIFRLGNWDVTGGLISWQQIEESLCIITGKSQVDPFSTNRIGDFNFWYYMIGLFTTLYSRGAWQGSMGYAAAAKNPHERKMAGVLAGWRGQAQWLMIMLFPLAVIVLLNHVDFGETATQINAVLDQYKSDPQMYKQARVATALSLIIPSGLLGLLVAVMFAAMLSTDDTYMHSWGSIFVQDVIMPFRKKPFTPKQQIWALRFSVIFVGIFAWCFSYFFRQTDYIYMFFALTGAIVSGAGASLVGGLYWKRGGRLAAWVRYISGAVMALSGIILQQIWKPFLAPWLAEHFKWEWVLNNMEKFPINGQWISFICMSTCATLYITISLYEHYVLGRKDYNMDKLLHRGAYDLDNEHQDQSSGNVGWLARRLGITKEFTTGDKLIYFATIAQTLMWFIIFLWFSIQRAIAGVPVSQWMKLWHFKLFFSLILGISCTIWFLVGGIKDVFGLFRALKNVRQDDADNGSVADKKEESPAEN
ncbi:MAG: sodium:solute symporter [Lentisphaeria bacterium]|nr:sodium:solute symporter [Lentisphaeria bacterium]